jgi:hypothetical protein
MIKARILVDFNEMLEPNLVLLSKEDTKRDSRNNIIPLYEGLLIYVYDENTDNNGNRDNLIAEGVVERNNTSSWGKNAKWCCRINEKGIQRESEIKDRDIF